MSHPALSVDEGLSITLNRIPSKYSIKPAIEVGGQLLFFAGLWQMYRNVSRHNVVWALDPTSYYRMGAEVKLGTFFPTPHDSEKLGLAARVGKTMM